MKTPTPVGKRGKLAAVSTPDGGVSLLAILPSNAANSTALVVLAGTARGQFRDWRVVYDVPSGCGWEPALDRRRLGQEGDGVLSLMLVNGTAVSVVDLEFA
jgi:hypothetical protein